jgi:hypothetical protein
LAHAEVPALARIKQTVVAVLRKHGVLPTPAPDFIGEELARLVLGGDMPERDDRR